jgi:hypothetical protein
MNLCPSRVILNRGMQKIQVIQHAPRESLVNCLMQVFSSVLST